MSIEKKESQRTGVHGSVSLARRMPKQNRSNSHFLLFFTSLSASLASEKLSLTSMAVQL